MNNHNHSITIAHMIDAEEPVAEIYYKNEQWAEVAFSIPENFIIQFFNKEDGDYWEFSFEEAMEILQEAKDRLAKLQRTPEEQKSYDEWIEKFEYDFNKKLGIMSPQERREIYPPFLVKEMEQIMESPKVKEELCDKVTDFLHLMQAIWAASSQEYQERFWVRKEPPMDHDSFEETTSTLIEDGRLALKQKDYGHIVMKERQYEMLKTLCDRVETFKASIDQKKSDEEVIHDPRWGEIREFAKLFYQEVTGEDS